MALSLAVLVSTPWLHWLAHCTALFYECVSVDLSMNELQAVPSAVVGVPCRLLRAYTATVAAQETDGEAAAGSGTGLGAWTGRLQVQSVEIITALHVGQSGPS